MPLNMNTGRFRTRRNCCHIKSNHSVEDLKNSGYYPCGENPENEEYLVKHYKDYINRGLEHLPYLEKKGCIVRKRKGFQKKPVIIQNNGINNDINNLNLDKDLVNTKDNICALSRLTNF